MKTLYIAPLAGLLMASGTYAADPYGSAAVVSSSSAYDWTGFYLGVHGGVGSASVQDVGNPSAAEQSLDGWVGGAQAGFNMQSGDFVYGVEADWSSTDIGSSWAGNETSPFDPYYGSDSITSIATIRGRLGMAVDRFMPFVTAGIAFGSTEHVLGCDADLVDLTNGCGANAGNGADDPGIPFEDSNSGMQVGWTIGAGAEFAVTDNISIKAEGLYGDLGEQTVALVDPYYPAATDRQFATTFSAVRIGLNARF